MRVKMNKCKCGVLKHADYDRCGACEEKKQKEKK